MTPPHREQGPSAVLATLHEIKDRLGSTLLEFPAELPQRPRAVTGMWMAEPGGDVRVDPGTLVLAPGNLGEVDVAELLDTVGGTASAIILSSNTLLSDQNKERALTAGLVVIRQAPEASWLQLAEVLRTLTHQKRPQEGPHDVAMAMDRLETDLRAAQAPDLFDVANSIAAILGAPVTIENLESRILAFSADQEAADDARKRSVLGHQVPLEYAQRLREMGAFKSIYESPEPVYMSSIGPGIRPRVGMRIRAGRELLGSIWGVVAEEPNAHQKRALVEAADMVALSMLRARTAADSSAKLRYGLLIMLLEGGAAAEEAAARIGITRHSAVVLAAGLAGTAMDATRPADDYASADSEVELDRLSTAIGLRLHAATHASVVARVGAHVYAVMPVGRKSMRAGEGLRIAHDLVNALNREDLVVGVGTVVGSAGRLNKSRAEADSALRVLLSRRARAGARNAPPASGGQQAVVCGDDVQVESLMLRLRDSLAAGREEASGPLADLQSYDLLHGSELVRSLSVWLDSQGDIASAANVLHVHQNTLRQRLKRLAEVSGSNLDDADERFSLMLQLRLFDVNVPGN